jgi:hypothetical protein
MPRYMIMVRATADSEAGVFPDDPGLVTRMMDFHQELAQAGVLLDACGLLPSRHGFRVRYSPQGEPTVLDGPFAEANELIAGYTLIEVRSHDEALAWARRFPSPFPGQDCAIEVRPLFGVVEDQSPVEAEQHMREQLREQLRQA